LRLGKKTEALYDRVAELSKQLDRYSYGPRVRFAEAEIDQARAAGVVIEFERARPILVDRSLYRELCKQAIARTVTELETQLARPRRGAKNTRHAAGQDPVAEARREGQRHRRRAVLRLRAARV
jgi:hypothetical protein